MSVLSEKGPPPGAATPRMADMADYIGFDPDDQYLTVAIVPKGTPVDLPDWEQEVTLDHAIFFSNGDFGALIEGSKAKLVGLLEGALQEAWSLPDDSEET